MSTPVEADDSGDSSAAMLPTFLRRLAQNAIDAGSKRISLNAKGARAIADELERSRADLAAAKADNAKLLEEFRKELETTAEELDESPTIYELIGIRHRILELLRTSSG